MAMEQLLAAIERQAGHEIEAELERGRREAAEVARVEAEQAARDREETLAREEERTRAALDAELATARLRGRRKVSEARQRFVDRVHEAMANRLTPLMKDERYLSSLADQLEACLDYIGNAPAVLLATPALVTRLQELVAGREGVAVEPDPGITTGFRLVSPDGNFAVDATLARALERRKREIEIALFRKLEEGA